MLSNGKRVVIAEDAAQNYEQSAFIYNERLAKWAFRQVLEFLGAGVGKPSLQRNLLRSYSFDSELVLGVT